jgi:outer membrane protein assembly factor BamB
VRPGRARSGAVLLLTSLGLAGIAAAKVAAQTGVGAAAAGDAWPQFRGTPALTGVSSATPAASLKIVWTAELDATVLSSPTVALDTIYVGTDAALVAIGLKDGRERWRAPVPDGIGESTAAVGGNRVFVGSLGGRVHAFDATSGRALWTFETGSEIKSSPVIVGDTLLIGSYDTHLYGLSAADGTLRWKVQTDNYVHGTPAVRDGIAYFGGCDEILRGVRVSDGREVSTIEIGSFIGASLALSGSRAYFGTFDSEVLGVDLTTGVVAWRYRHPDQEFPFYSSAAVADGVVVLGGRDKMVHGIDAASGKGLWTYTTRARVESSPAIAAGRVYIGSTDGRFYVLDLKTGKEIWQFNAGSPVASSPAIVDGCVIFSSDDGRVFCLG